MSRPPKYTDCPLCPKCNHKTVVCVEGAINPNHLCCVACGEDFIGDDAQVKKARAADKAWERYEERGDESLTEEQKQQRKIKRERMAKARKAQGKLF